MRRYKIPPSCVGPPSLLACHSCSAFGREGVFLRELGFQGQDGVASTVASTLVSSNQFNNNISGRAGDATCRFLRRFRPFASARRSGDVFAASAVALAWYTRW